MFLKINVIIILLNIKFLLPVLANYVLVDKCKSNEICMPLSECDQINHRVHWTKLNFCKSDYSSVCCRQKQLVFESRYILEEDEKRFFVERCLNYHDEIYKNCPSTPFITNGTRVESKEFPHMALIGEKLQNTPPNWKCGGSLISTKYVLTAAHCLEPNINYVRLGELDYSRNDDDARPQDFYIKTKIVHPNFEFSSDTNDIGLIELDGIAILNEYVVPACLPLVNGSEFSDFIVSGWGAIANSGPSSAHLQKVQIQRFTDNECVETAENIGSEYRPRTQLCAGPRIGTNDTCQGDSGGPLFVQHPDSKFACMHLIIGVTAFGGECGDGNPAFYTRVNVFVNWIENVVWKIKQ